jgi:hypothetical protein
MHLEIKTKEECMKKDLNKNRKNPETNADKVWTNVADKGEKTVDTVPLNQEISQDFRALNDEMQPANPNENTNWSQETDRSEDLINARDPFMQQPERDSEVPPELNQAHATDDNDKYSDLSALFEDERKPRKYHRKW